MDKLKLKHNLRGSTIIETLTAMVLTVTVFSIASGIYINIMNSDKNMNSLKADELMKLTYQEFKLGIFSEERINSSEVSIEKTVKSYKGIEGILWVKLEVFDRDGKKIGFRNDLIFKP
jgi:Tfp pilus assembly protein PilV